MQVEMRPIASIRPYESNPRLHDAAVDTAAAWTRQLGFRQFLVVDEDGVSVVGHPRYKAALKLGLGTVHVHVAVGLTKAQLKTYRHGARRLPRREFAVLRRKDKFMGLLDGRRLQCVLKPVALASRRHRAEV
jgi:ParB-like chromosome segregation protein Spo0J